MVGSLTCNVTLAAILVAAASVWQPSFIVFTESAAMLGAILLHWKWTDWEAKKLGLKHSFSTAASGVIVACISRIFTKDVQAMKQHHNTFCEERICAKIQGSKNYDAIEDKERGIEQLIVTEFPFLECEQVSLERAEKVVLTLWPILMRIGQGERLWKWLLQARTSIVSEAVASELSQDSGPLQDSSSLYSAVRFVCRADTGDSKAQKTMLAFQIPCTPTRWVFMEKNAAILLNAKFYQVHWTPTSVRSHPLYDELLEQFKTATPQQLEKFAGKRFKAYSSLKQDCETSLLFAGASSRGLLLKPAWTKEESLSDSLATAPWVLGQPEELTAVHPPTAGIIEAEAANDPALPNTSWATEFAAVTVGAYAPMANQSEFARRFQVPESRGGICYAAAAATLVSAANSRVFMLDYRGSWKKYPEEFDQESIARKIVDMNHAIRPAPTQRGGSPQALIPMVYPHLECREIKVEQALEVLLHTPRPVLMIFYMAKFAWRRFSEFDRTSLRTGGILTAAAAKTMVQPPEQAGSEECEKSGHAVVAVFVGSNGGQKVLVIKNSWGAETHGAKGWLLMEAEAAAHLAASYHSVFWTTRSLRSHPRGAELQQHWRVASEGDKAAFNAYRREQSQQQWHACNRALVQTMGGGHGFRLQPLDQVTARYLVV